MHEIHIEKQWQYHASVLFGLLITAPVDEFPLLVGCSLKTKDGEVVDQKARWITSPGKALWKIEADSRFMERLDWGDKEWVGKIIFALYRDDSHEERLADTEWTQWKAPFLIGYSTAGLDMEEEFIRKEYDGRFDVWIKNV